MPFGRIPTCKRSKDVFRFDYKTTWTGDLCGIEVFNLPDGYNFGIFPKQG